MQDPPPVTSQAPPPLRRPRRLLRALGIVVLLLAVVASIPGFLGWRAGVALQKRVDELAAAGEPMTLADLFPAMPDDSRNGYIELKRAMDLIDNESQASVRLDLYPEKFALPFTDHEREMLASVVPERAAAVALVEAASKKPECRVDFVRTVVGSENMPDLNRLRDISTALYWQALHEFDQGRHDEAVRHLRLLDTVARGAGSHGGVVPFLVGLGIRNYELEALTDFAPDLKIGAAPGDVSPTLVRQVIDKLVDDRSLKDEARFAWRVDRVDQMRLMRAIDEGTFHPDTGTKTLGPGKASRTAAIPRYLSRSKTRGTALSLLDADTDRLAALDAVDWPAAFAVITSRRDARSGKTAATVAESALASATDRASQAYFRILTDRRLAAISLACRWYEKDNGALPESLEQLSPKYLPTVLLDPMAAGRPFCSRLSGDDPIVYSVSENGVDDGGDESDLYDGKRSYTWKQPDRMSHLRREPRQFSEELAKLAHLELDKIVGPLPAPVFEKVDFTAVEIDTPDFEQLKSFKITSGPKEMRSAHAAYDRLLRGDAVNSGAPTAAAEEFAMPYCGGAFETEAGRWRFQIYTGRGFVLIDPNGKTGAFVCRRPMVFQPQSPTTAPTP